MITYSIAKRELGNDQLDVLRYKISVDECCQVLDSIVEANGLISRYYVYFMLGEVAQIRMSASDFLDEMHNAAKLLEEQ
jgi:hypothetical protein